MESYDATVNRVEILSSVPGLLDGDAIVDLGGFENFVHLHQMQRTIRLRFDLNLASVSLDREWLIDERVPAEAS